MTPSPNYFNAHLREVDESYGRHFLHAGYYFVMLLAAAICAILPFLFEKTSSQIILKLYTKMTARKLFDAQSSSQG